MTMENQIEDLVSNRDKFNEFVYTPLAQAVEELKNRWPDSNLEKAVTDYLHGDIPSIFKNGSRLVIFRHLCTANYELHRFISIADAYEMAPIFHEYHKDKFTSNNPTKYHLGKLSFHLGYGKDGTHRVKKENIIDFNTANGKPISSIKTHWGQQLVDFHRELFLSKYPQFTDEDVFFDSSEWFHRNGGSAKEYYKIFLTLFIRHGILFENFVIEDDQELTFTKEYFLPAFFDVWKRFGKKPLIVALEPTDIEGSNFWTCYHPHLLNHVQAKLKTTPAVNGL